jgi:hypothetical protein
MSSLWHKSRWFSKRQLCDPGCIPWLGHCSLMYLHVLATQYRDGYAHPPRHPALRGPTTTRHSRLGLSLSRGHAACGAGRQTTMRARGLQDGPCGLPRRRGPQVHPCGRPDAKPAPRCKQRPILRSGCCCAGATHSRKHTRRLQEAPPWKRPRALSMWQTNTRCDSVVLTAQA